jgi:hypothetical protein
VAFGRAGKPLENPFFALSGVSIDALVMTGCNGI